MSRIREKSTDIVTGKQLAAPAFVGLLSPMIRLLPRSATLIAGNAAAVSPLFAAVPVFILFFIARIFIKYRREGEGLAEFAVSVLGKAAGGTVCALYLLWFVFYAAVILRSSGERFLSTIYPGGSLFVFMSVTLAISLAGAAGRLKSLTATSQFFLGILIGVLISIFMMSIPQVDMQNLLPITLDDTGNILLAALPTANVLSPAVYVLFLGGKCRKDSFKPVFTAVMICGLLIAAFLLIFCVVGIFGAAFADNMQNPFFTMIRNVSVFDVVERTEAFVVALWVLTDFVFLSVLIKYAGTVLTVLTGADKKPWFLAATGAAVFVGAYLLGGSDFSFRFISETVCPAVNAVFAFGLFPIICFTGLIRRRTEKT